MTAWTLLFLVVGAILPVAVACLTVFFGTRGQRGSGAIVKGAVIGIAAGAAGGLLASAVVVALVLALRAAR